MKKNSGLTLIESMFVIVILGILGSLAIPRIDPSEGGTAYALTRQIVADMRYARSLAITSAKPYTLKFSPSGGPYTSYAIFQEETQFGDTNPIPSSINCTATADEYEFSYLGSANDNGTVTIAGGGSGYIINLIAATGRAFEEKIE